MSENNSNQTIEQKFFLEQRKFLHDMATPLTVLKTILKRIEKDFQTKEANPELTKSSMERLQKAIESVQKIENMHADNKAQIFNWENNNKKAA
jgi:hypothetical protein